MSFAVWHQKPPFPESELNASERIYEIGDKWVVTDEGEPTEEKINALLNPPKRAAEPTASDILDALPTDVRDRVIANLESKR